MFESHYLKPFIVSLGITIMLISGMGLSLRGIVGTGVAYDAAEVSFHLPDDSESDAETTVIEPTPKDKPSVEPPTPEGPAPKADPLVTENTGDESIHNLNANKTTSNARREWDITSDPNANGNGFAEASDLSFLSDLAWSLLNSGQQALLQKPDINPQEYLKTVQEQGKRSIVTGRVVVRVNFDVDGHVIVGEHTPLIAEDVPQPVKEEAMRIVKSSGSIINRRGEPVYLAVPVVLGQ